MIQIMATASVFVTGGPICPLKLGRVDTMVPDSTAGLPSNCFQAASLISTFGQWARAACCSEGF